jgi:DNA invertase Pin-like site-specific DNA recombinase
MYTTTEITGKAAIYLRISDKKKQDVGRQVKMMKEWCKRHPGVELVLQYVERETGRGGYRRKQLNKLLKDATSNCFNIAIFWEADRLGRNVNEALTRIAHLHRHKVKVYIADINQWYDYNDPSTVMVLQQMLVFAEFESAMNSKRTKEGNSAKLSKIAKRIKQGKLPKGARVGQPSIVEQWISDPDGKEGKKALLVAPDLKKVAFFKAVWEDEEIHSAYEIIAEMLRVPISPKCANKCRIGDDGNVAKPPTAKCHCGNKPADKTIHKAREALGLEPRNVYSFKRVDVPRGTTADILESLTAEAEA